MAVNQKYNNLSRKSVTVPAYSVTTVEYNDSMPNYYRVINMGDGKLYCGTSAIPTTKRFEFTVGPGKIKLYTEPSRRNNLYIYNPSGVDVDVIIVSFEAEFDPATLAMADMEFDVANQTMTTETTITGFNQPLPAGTNNIGKVTLADHAKYEEYLVAIRDAAKVLDTRSRRFAHCKSGTATSAGVIYNTAATICHIAFLSNDGETALTLTLTEDDGTVNSIEVKAGEVLNNIECTLASIKVSGNNVPFRMIYNERNGG